MRSRTAACLAVAAAFAIPTVALADGGLGLHSTDYEQHPAVSRPGNNVGITFQRDRGNAGILVDNFCLGSVRVASQTWQREALVLQAPVRHGKISYHGRASVYGGKVTHNVPIRFSATLMASKAIGAVTFPGTKCGTIRFVAKVAAKTP